MYGIQTLALGGKEIKPFENDVKMYGIQTITQQSQKKDSFENDVKMYGIQTNPTRGKQGISLRMM